MGDVQPAEVQVLRDDDSFLRHRKGHDLLVAQAPDRPLAQVVYLMSDSLQRCPKRHWDVLVEEKA